MTVLLALNSFLLKNQLPALAFIASCQKLQKCQGFQWQCMAHFVEQNAFLGSARHVLLYNALCWACSALRTMAAKSQKHTLWS